MQQGQMNWFVAEVPHTRENRRDLDHVIKILRAASKGVKKTELRHRCGLSPPLLGRYLSALVELNLLEAKDTEEIHYKTTQKGLELLHTYHKLKWLIWGGTLDFMLVGLLSQLKMDKKEHDKYSTYIS